MEMHHSNARLYIYRMGDALAFVIKGDAFAFVMGDALAFVIKGDAPREMCVSFT
jgi:hypothetical protein